MANFLDPPSTHLWRHLAKLTSQALVSATFIPLFYVVDMVLFIMPYSNGGIKYFDNFNKTMPFVDIKMGTNNIFSQIPISLIEVTSYLIIFVCGFKMVRFVNLNTNFDENLKRLNKLLTKALIILAIIPFVNQAGEIYFIISSKTTDDTSNIIRILIAISFHFIPVFNPIICILTNTPYRKAIFNRVQIHPQ
uniref:Uncharacterized protein n=1 Tax=Meloidogyne enterolobii TaxID=390850 RepID=A0A6V7XQZ2_MELEN|nr:unnamed protein product [Meloidogyne enterolobii]